MAVGPFSVLCVVCPLCGRFGVYQQNCYDGTPCPDGRPSMSFPDKHEHVQVFVYMHIYPDARYSRTDLLLVSYVVRRGANEKGKLRFRLAEPIQKNPRLSRLYCTGTNSLNVLCLTIWLGDAKNCITNVLDETLTYLILNRTNLKIVKCTCLPT